MKTKVILSQQMASAIIAAGQEEAQKNNWSVSIAVADDGGHLLALSRSRCLRARHRGSWFSTLRRLCYRLRLRFHGCLRFFRFNHRLLTSWARSGRTFSGLRFRRVTRCIAIANRRNRCGFSRQRGIDRHIVQLLLILWLGQRIVQVTLHFNTLLTIRCHISRPAGA